ncbi:unnamed protein product [Rotaria sp. Silwood1]|nr:unnamed protein product [Rotaria sp. Silwood1]
MPIEVIVAGLPRSGTLSMHNALERLGYYKTIHTLAHRTTTEQMEAWREIYEKHLEKTWTNDDWQKMMNTVYRDFVGTADAPSCDFAVELARAYPEAKVILLYRAPDKWYKSHQHLRAQFNLSYWELFLILQEKRARSLVQMARAEYAWWDEVYDYSNRGKDVMPFYMNKIRTNIDAKRILEFKVQDGWEPLCKFLGKEIPEEDFPHSNDAQALSEERNQIKNEALAIVVQRLKKVLITISMLTIVGSIYWRGLFFNWS